MKEEKFKNNVLWYNFTLCILVVCIHAQNMHIFIEPVAWINHAIWFLVERIACLAVPGFFMCSGYLFYRNLTWKKVTEKLKQRVFSLVIPFLIWNFLYYILHFVARRIPYFGQLFDTAVPFSLQEFINAVFCYKYNPVFWFMLYLILFSFMSPIIYGVLRQKWVGLFVVILVLVINFSGVLVSYIPVKTGDILGWSFYYLTGGYIGIHWTEIIMPKKKYLPVVILGIGMCFSFVLSFVYGENGWIYIYKMCGAAFLWYFISAIELAQAPGWMKNTFVIYAVHQIMALFINKLTNLLFGNSMYVGGIIFLFIPVVVVVFCYFMELFMKTYFPTVWKIISGRT